MLIQLGADDHQLAAHIGTALTDFPLAGNVIELQPAVGTAVHDALGAEDHAVIAGVQLGEGVLNVSLGELLGRLDAPAGKDLVGVMMVMFMVVAAAGAAVAVVMVMFIVVVMMFMFMLVMVMITAMLVLVFIMIVVMVVFVFVVVMFIVIMVVVVLMLVMIVMMLMLFFVKQLG